MQGISRFYSKIKGLLFVLNIAFTMLFLFVMSYSFSRLLRDAVTFLTGNTIIVITIYFVLFYFFYFLFIFILRYLEGFVLENHIKNKKQKFKKWFKRLLAKELINFVLLLIGVQVVYFFLETSVNAWWIPMSVLAVMARNIWEFLPSWIVPYYSRHKDLDNRSLQDRLHKLAQKAGIRFVRIVTYKDSKARVVIVGLKNSLRLILSEEVLNYATEEAEVLVAMEIAKLRNGYTWKKTAMEAAGMFITFFIVSIIFAPACEKFGH